MIYENLRIREVPKELHEDLINKKCCDLPRDISLKSFIDNNSATRI